MLTALRRLLSRKTFLSGMGRNTSENSELDARVARAVDGSVDELEALLGEITPELRSGLHIQPLCRRCFEIDDVIQVTLLEAFLRVATLEQRTYNGFRRWLWRIAENNLKDAVRALERDKRPDPHRRQTQGPKGETARTLLSAVAGKHSTIGSRAAAQEEIARMHTAIRKLPASYRTVVQRVDLDEVPVSEVAGEMGKSPGAVHMLRSRAHERLTELLR